MLPNAQVTCWLLKTNDQVTAMLKRRFPNVPIVQGNLDDNGKSPTPELQKAFAECDVLVHNSGMHYNRFWQPPVGLMYAARTGKKQIVLYGQSFDGFRPQDLPAVLKLLPGESCIYTRDTPSLDWLRSNPVTPPVLEWGPDGCFGIDVRDDDKARAFMTAHGLEPQKFLAVIVRTDVPENNKADGASAEKNKAQVAVWIEKYTKVICDIACTTKMKVALVPEVEREIWSAKTMILDDLPDDANPAVVWKDIWWCSDEAVSLYSQAHALVALEPHSCIMAIANGTPAIHFYRLAHGTKAFMFHDIGLPEWLINVDEESPEAVLRALSRVRSDYDLALAKVARAIDFVYARSREMATDIAALKAPADPAHA